MWWQEWATASELRPVRSVLGLADNRVGVSVQSGPVESAESDLLAGNSLAYVASTIMDDLLQHGVSNAGTFPQDK